MRDADYEDYTGDIGPDGGDSPWPMHSFGRVAFLYWNGFANALREAGYEREEIRRILQSKLMRLMLDHEGEELYALGRRMGAELARKGRRDIREMLSELE